MRTTLNQALEHGLNGYWNKAWEVAKQDEGLNNDVTRETWIKYALKCLARREQKQSPMPAAYYS